VGDPAPDLADVVGQEDARHAMEVAAAGGHHVFLTGPPGVGKTMLAERLPGLLPNLSQDEALEVTSIHSLLGRLPAGRPLVTRPPFCAPHHTATVAALIGGGTGIPTPGTISLAHHGVLFVDEATEFERRTLDALRQPLESGTVTINRAAGTATYPSRFQLILAANPCPCAKGGRSTDPSNCVCSSVEIRAYRNRVSGPLLDRIDLRARLAPISRAILTLGATGEPSNAVRERVELARDRAARRLRGTPWTTNSAVPGPVLRQRFPLPSGALGTLKIDTDRGQLSSRGVERVMKVAWTVADLAGHDVPDLGDVDAARSLRYGPDAVALARSA
jgi:magnesium chelatase family protein